MPPTPRSGAPTQSEDWTICGAHPSRQSLDVEDGTCGCQAGHRIREAAVTSVAVAVLLTIDTPALLIAPLSKRHALPVDGENLIAVRKMKHGSHARYTQ